MKRRSFIKLSSSLVAGSLFSDTILSSPEKSIERPLILGVFPRRNTRQTFKLFSPMANFLGEALNTQVKLETAKNFNHFWQSVKERRYDIVHYNQYHYIISNLLYNYEVILKSQEFGNSTIAGAIIVRKDSGINSLDELKNKTIMFGGGKMAMQSYIASKWLLKQAGLNDGDYHEKIAINPPNAIISTYRKQADAAGSGDVVIRLDIVKNSIDVAQMKYLGVTKQLAHLPWAVKADLPTELKLKIQQTLSSLNTHTDGQLILDNAKMTALIPTVDSDYNAHRTIVRDVYGDNYGIEKFK